jgi:hypothetical protein
MWYVQPGRRVVVHDVAGELVLDRVDLAQELVDQGVVAQLDEQRLRVVRVRRRERGVHAGPERVGDVQVVDRLDVAALLPGRRAEVAGRAGRAEQLLVRVVLLPRGAPRVERLLDGVDGGPARADLQRAGVRRRVDLRERGVDVDRARVAADELSGVAADDDVHGAGHQRVASKSTCRSTW